MFNETDIILKAEHVSKEFANPDGTKVRACNDICLELKRGQTLGIVGESGCGKSTFVKMLVNINKPDEGRIIVNERDISKLRGREARENCKNIQMVFQDPGEALNPRMKVWDIVTEPLANLKMIKKEDRRGKASELLKLVELPDSFLDRYPHSMSGGQRQRVGIARALSLNPEIIICDEATSALDVSIQKSITELLVRLQKERGISYIFIGHDPLLVQSISHTVAVMYLGNIVEIIPGEKLCTESVHPYTKALLDSMFTLDMDFSRPVNCIKGEVTSANSDMTGCPFYVRCPYAMEKCKINKPELKKTGDRHFAACYNVE